MSTEEGNRLIAEFMGCKKIPNHDGYHIVYGFRNGDTETKDLRYHSSWDWLVPVLKKIRNFLQEEIKKRPPHTACQGDLIEVDIQCCLWELDIERTWKHTIDFIKWFNSQNKSI